ncbi:cytochrome P450 [Actinocorallia sp. API 0066]|uniref:cytochrome P450 n=1 Tax=Actinocorallia sp. API 0066 TaxID=2896846 RepID=UPI001E5251F0|nr:cytochrome P450 [Actinocorallia sp. API 0066]MCD0449885.1 cytochrome P450 [Actinocorallia sp. API 0066]
MDLHYSPFDFAIQNDPYPVYKRLREEAPVYRNDEDDFYALSLHADVVAALKDSERYSSKNGLRLEPAFWGPQAEQIFSFVAMDPPRHTRLRSLVQSAFTNKRVQALEPRLREIARAHLEPLLSGDTFDLMHFAGGFPTDVISELVGVPEEDRDRIRELGMAIMYREPDGGPVRDLPPSAMAAVGALVGYYTELTIDRAKIRKDDLLSGLLDAAEGDDRLTPEEVVSILILLVGAGIETTMLLLGNAWHAAWSHPDQKALALGGRIDDWVEEALRYDPPSQTIARTTTTEVEVRGVTIPAESRILLMVGAANHDPAVFEDADAFVLGRDTSGSLAFGHGRHHCMGSILGRLETRIALQTLSSVIADYEIDDANAARVGSSNNRGFASLPTSYTVR